MRFKRVVPGKDLNEILWLLSTRYLVLDVRSLYCTLELTTSTMPRIGLLGGEDPMVGVARDARRHSVG